MPRAFLITHRRYNGTEEFQTPGREYSPEGRVGLAEYVGSGQPTSDGVSDCASESSSECPEELYNLTKLAEVSLAAAAGTLIRPSTPPPQWQGSRVVRALRTVVVPAGNSHHRRYRDAGDQMDEIESNLREKTRLFFERIESEGESLAATGQHRSEQPASNNVASGSGIIERSSSSEGSKSDDSGEDHECPDCGKKYSTSSNLARHRQTHRSLGDKKARRCPHCDKIYVSMPAFGMHVRTHNQGCKCHYCGKCFSRPWLLQGHIRTHTGEKPFKCTICNKAFADKSNLRAHVQTHSNTKPHVCGRCGKAFALKSYLYKHEESSCMRAHHKSACFDKNEPGGDHPAVLRVMAEPVLVTASPTSVIVQCFTNNRALPPPPPPLSSSSIIRHTKNHTPGLVASKRHCREGGGGGGGDSCCNVDEESCKISKIVKPADEELVSRRRVLVRTSVISTNPSPTTPSLNFADSRLNLNLAIA